MFMTLIYIDTNVYLDYFEGRTDKFRPLGEFAYQIFQRTLSCEFRIIISTTLVKELENNIQKQRIYEFLGELEEKDKIVNGVIMKEDKERAQGIVRERKTPFNDTLHVVIANRMKADYFITRNVKDFIELQDFVKILLPEHL